MTILEYPDTCGYCDQEVTEYNDDSYDEGHLIRWDGVPACPRCRATFAAQDAAVVALREQLSEAARMHAHGTLSLADLEGVAVALCEARRIAEPATFEVAS